MFLQHLEHAIALLQRQIELDFFRQFGSGRSASAWWVRCVSSSTSSCSRIIPRGLVVALRLGVKAGENTVRIAWQLKAGFDDKCRVREVDQVIFRNAIIFDGIANDAAEEGDV